MNPLSSPGLDLASRNDLVAICYSLWFNPVVREGQPVYNIADILADNPEHPQWGPLEAFHYWAEPAVGYYRSDDSTVMRMHIGQLQDAGIDVIVLDHTNGRSVWKDAFMDDIFRNPAKLFLDTLLDMRVAGAQTPHIMFWAGSWLDAPDPAFCGRDIYRLFYQTGDYDELFVYSEGKPMLLLTEQMPTELEQKFSLRRMWGLQETLAEREWSFLQLYPQNVAFHRGEPEQLSVTTALQQTHMTKPDAIPRRGGRTFQEQWRRAFDIRPRIVVLTWWNEWCAMRFEDEDGVVFVDNYTRELSRDIEPMKGGHGDQYYRWMKEYIRCYKGRASFPEHLLE